MAATSAGEPSIGRNWKAGKTLFTSYTDEYVVDVDGASTWTRVSDDVTDRPADLRDSHQIYGSSCSGIHGHVRVAPDGTVHVDCSEGTGKPRIAVSRDLGDTWAPPVDVGIPVSTCTTASSPRSSPMTATAGPSPSLAPSRAVRRRPRHAARALAAQPSGLPATGTTPLLVKGALLLLGAAPARGAVG